MSGALDRSSLMSRREVLAALAGVALGATGGVLVTLSISADEPSTLDLGPVQDLLARLDAADGLPIVPAVDPAQRPVPVVRWDASDERARGIYADQAIASNAVGLMALSGRSTYLGCRVQLCESSGYFEDPCHAGRWNRWGEHVAGPATRGLDRYRTEITTDGRFLVHLDQIVTGLPLGEAVFSLDADGPTCIR